MKRITIFNFIIFVGIFFYGVGTFGSQTDIKIESFKKQAHEIDRKIEKNKAEIEKIAQKENAIINSLNKTGVAINKARKQARSLQSELTGLENKINKTTEASRKLMEQIRIREDYASRRVTALYKLSYLGKIHLLASANSVTDFFQRKTSLERILAYDKHLLETLAEDKADLQHVLDHLNAQKKEKLSLEAAHQKQVRIMSRKKSRTLKTPCEYP